MRCCFDDIIDGVVNNHCMMMLFQSDQVFIARRGHYDYKIHNLGIYTVTNSEQL